MRLIDADELINILEWNKEQEKDALVSINSLIKLIKERPTAYDVNKVIEELKEMGNEYCKSVECNGECDCCEHASMMQSAIKIVKGGINGLD